MSSRPYIQTDIPIQSPRPQKYHFDVNGLRTENTSNNHFVARLLMPKRPEFFDD